jgi:hypothetical protein
VPRPYNLQWGEIMSQQSNLPYRHSVRLKDYHYGSQGAYFVTICTYQRQHLFGEITDGIMNKNQWGDMAWDF